MWNRNTIKIGKIIINYIPKKKKKIVLNIIQNRKKSDENVKKNKNKKKYNVACLCIYEYKYVSKIDWSQDIARGPT